MPAEDAATSRWRSFTNRATSHNVLAAVPILLVNGTAFIGQFAWTREHVPWIIPGQVLFSVALESVAIYLAWHAHLAQLANDSASRLKLAAYSFALIIGAMNYSHYADHWRPTALAVGLGLMSALSPWLWGIHSRRVSRDQLMERGLVEEHALRLGATRWTWHLYRSAKVMFRATWIGETSPKRAIEPFAGRWGALVPDEPVRHIVPLPQLAQPDPVPALAAPAVPETVPSASVPAGSPAVPSLTIPDPYTEEHHLTADPIEPPDEPEAHLAAAPKMGGSSKRPPEEVVEAAVKTLAEIPLDKLPSERAIARDLLGDPQQRRLGKKLRDDRIADEAQRAMESLNPAGPPAPAANRQARPDRPQHIAAPASTLPGGGEAR